MQIFFRCLTTADPDGTLQIRQHIIGLCDDVQDLALGEILVTRLGQGYITSGTGFSHYAAGRSVNILISFSRWTDCHEWCRAHTPQMATHNEEVDRVRAAYRAANPPIRLSRSNRLHCILLGAVLIGRSEDPRFMEGEIEEVD